MTQDKKQFTKLFLLTALPVALQNLLQNSLSFIDTMMIGRLGENAIAAVGIGAQIFFLITVILFGVSSGCGIFMSQYWGSQDHIGIRKTTGFAFVVAIVSSLLLGLISVFKPQIIVGFFVDKGVVFDLGCVYLRWTGASFICTGINMVLNCLMRSVGQPKIPMVITMISMITDVVGNYVLIFVLGWGVKGAAIATALSRLLESILLVIALNLKCPVKIKFSDLLSIDGAFVRKITKTTLPVLIDDALWALGMTAYKVIHAHMGVDVLACANVMGTIQDMFFVVQNGLGAAGAVLIGNEIGRGNKDKAFDYSKLTIIYGTIAGVITTFMMIGTSTLIPRLFSLSDSVYEITVKCMITLGLLMPVKFANHMNVVGVLRSGADTNFVLWVEFFSVWFIGVPFTYLSAMVWGMPIFIVFLFTGLEEVVKLFIVLPRIHSRKWITNLTN